MTKISITLMKEARVFVNSLPMPTRKKVYNNIERVIGGERNAELFKKLEGTNIWEKSLRRRKEKKLRKLKH